MGTAGREILKLDANELINDLNKGVAAELHEAYRYQLLAKLVSGPRAGELAQMFTRMSQSEWNHLGLLMDRIVQLGGRPIPTPAAAERQSYVPYKEPPADPTDLKRIVEDTLEGERAAIRYWQTLLDKTQHADPVTAELAKQALVDEVKDEDNLERFIRGWN